MNNKRLGAVVLYAVMGWWGQATTHTVQVEADGSFVPPSLEIFSGDTVVWHFTNRTDTIIPIDFDPQDPSHCGSYRAYDPADLNEFTGPMPRGASGLFSLSPEESPYASQDATWRNTNLAGVFIRLRWDDVHRGTNQYFWKEMDQEIQKAVAHGKLYSLGFKAGRRGTPQWIFSADHNDAKVQRLDFGFQEDGAPVYLGSPADPNYRKHYFDLLNAAVAHLRRSNAWYRALAYVKVAGANLASHENRLPAEPGDLPVWAAQGHYRPTDLYQFYREQTALIASSFPHKDMNFALIQGGFPEINDQGEYDGQPNPPPTHDIPKSATQVETVIDEGRTNHGLRFVVAHNGLQPKPTSLTCPNEGVHPIIPDPQFPYVGSGCPNNWVLGQSAQGQLSGFQSVNYLTNVTLLESAFENGWDNSDAVYLELYEDILLEAATTELPSGLTLGDWAGRFHARRRIRWPALPEPFPLTHEHRFTHTLAGDEPQTFHYVNGTQCSGRLGVIVVLPPPRITGFQRLPDGAVQMNVHLPRGGTLTPQYSTNLIHWVSLEPRLVDAGVLLIGDAAASFRANPTTYFRVELE